MFISLSLTSPSIQVSFPKIITSESVKEENLILTITSENVIYLDNAVVTLKELRLQLAKGASKNRPILIKSDRRASLGRMIDVWNLCRELGVEKINIATDQEK